ncbi:MAG: polysaccharide biosynthesis protein [Gammaproteobacteria bacterium]|nr:polysaccharide biosynthesis protein [Gammaproteobacteria bacterium]
MKDVINRWRSRSIAFISDFLAIPTAWLGAFLLNDNLALSHLSLQALPLITTIQALAFISQGLYRGIWRFASIPDLVRILRSVALGTAVIFLMLSYKQSSISPATLVIYALLLTFLLSGTRVLFRLLRDYFCSIKQHEKVLIVGAGSVGESIARDLLRLRHQPYRAAAFVDDDVKKLGCEIHGVRVVGFCQDIPTLVKTLHIRLILIATPSATPGMLRQIVSYCEAAQVPFRTLPGLKDITAGTVRLNTLREVLLENLLGREEAKLDWDKITDTLDQKTVLVSGGGGSIGAELCRQILRKTPLSLIIIDNNEFNLYSIEMELKKRFPQADLHCLLCSVTDKIGVKAIFDKHKPALVFHAAAYKHVPLLENQPRQAVYNNIVGTRQLVDVAINAHAEKFILISTDKAVNPTNVMGATKRVSEMICQNMNFHSSTQFITVRFGNVLDSAGSVLPLFRKQLSEGGPLTVTHPEITRYFMTISEASQLILQAATMGKNGEIFVLDMGEPVKINYLAEQMIKLSGKILGEDIEIKYVGLRPGEKLHEELFHEHEELTSTSHIKIHQAKGRPGNFTSLLHLLNQLEVACHDDDENKIQQLLLQLVPEYQSEKRIKESPLFTEDEIQASLSYA